MNNQSFAELKKYAACFCDKKYIESGYIALREEDGILLTTSKANLADLKEDEVVFVNDKNIESYEGNFRAAAVILFCAVRQDKTAEAAAIVDSDAILAYSSKRKTMMPILDEVAWLCGISVKGASKNVAAEIVTSLSSLRNACFMPDAGAVVKGRSLADVLEATAVLDKAANAELLASKKGGTKHLGTISALVENLLYKFKASKNSKKAEPAPASGPAPEVKQDAEEVKQDAPADVTETPAEPTTEPETESTEATEATPESTEVPVEAESIDETPSEPESEEVPAEPTHEPETTPASEPAPEVKYDVLNAGEEAQGVYILARTYYASAVAAMAVEMPVPADYVQELGEKLPCAPSARARSHKAIKNVLASIGNAPACFLAQHGVVVHASDIPAALALLNVVESASKSYLS